ncbi:5-deoxy-glucuronate isomerase [Ruania zhangjianzhongii]|uniref:5-deoxy-glucuronate isomerase n=1 Tax=Ruania zhangjianzhongii TaxID=2603206 RepID=UPI0011C964AD|nr:5-deoxy-glucuronate isomerase [Ruania zhangjianzhongii]
MTAVFHPAGSLAGGGLELDLTPERAGWGYSGLKTLALHPGESHELDTGEDEALVLPLSGGLSAEVDGGTQVLHGRREVFTSLTDFLYLPRECRAVLSSSAGGRFAIATARAEQRLQPRRYGAEQVEVTLRGAGSASREPRNYALGNGVVTDRLLVVEVITPGGNFSSYPPHKHDTHSAVERELEEIYYFQMRRENGVGYHRQYSAGTRPEPVDLLTEVRSGDLVQVPHGYHGPCIAPPGEDMYYLNVMAGPQRDGVWLMTDDPDYTWVRQTWVGSAVDDRLPMTESS